MSFLGDLLNTVFDRRLPGLSMRLSRDDTRDGAELARAMMQASGEDDQRLLAETLLARYETLGDGSKRDLFRHMTTEMDVDPVAVRAALADYERTPNKATYRAFAAAAEPSRQDLIRRINRVTGATGRIVGIRADLRRMIAEGGEDATRLGALDEDFRHLLASWFNRGFLVLRPITWQTPAALLEKIIAYEAVHDIDGWDDLRGRLQPTDRRCFAFFHPAMPDEPLIFVEVALTHGTPTAIHEVLAKGRAPIAAEDADTACFYSISNCQPGLAGISFGNSLIKQVVADLRVELPQLRRFVTLSPVPGLAQWCQAEGMQSVLATPEQARKAAAHYLVQVKRDDGTPRDPVARFHLGNGAQLEAVHVDADLSDRGLAQSGGVMVNYLYDLAQVASNHARFAETGAVAASPSVRALASELTFKEAS